MIPTSTDTDTYFLVEGRSEYRFRHISLYTVVITNRLTPESAVSTLTSTTISINALPSQSARTSPPFRL